MSNLELHELAEVRALYEEGKSIQQVADELGLSYTATRYRLLKARTKLRAKNGKQKVKRNVSSD